jgi:hypothetical protein
VPREGAHGTANAPPWRARCVRAFRQWRRPCLAFSKAFLPAVVLAAVAIGGMYIRLLNGPISLKVLAEPIARAIAGELDGLGVVIEDALVRLNEQGGVEFRLRNVRLLEEDGSPVANAPLAAVELSLEALWSGRISPSKVVLIEPRLLLFYSPDSGLALSFTRPAEAPELTRGTLLEPVIGQLAQTRVQDTAAPPVDPHPPVLRQLNIGAMIARASAHARGGRDAASFLREIGLRNATVIFDHPTRQSVWRVPQADLALVHKKKSSLISGAITVASTSGPWTFEFRAQDSEKTKTVSLNASVRHIVPGTIAHTLPELSILQALEMPVGGDISLDLAATGELLGGTLSVQMSRGNLHLPWLEDIPLAIDSGRVDLKYERGLHRLQITAATLLWGRNRLAMNGAITTMTDAVGGEAWAFDLAAVDGQLAAEEFGDLSLPVEGWVAKGSLRPRTGMLELKQFLVRVGGGQIGLTGELGGGDASAVRLAGQISPMSMSAFKVLWPRMLAPGARTWVGERIVRGRVLGGAFGYQSGQAVGADTAGHPQQRLSLALEVGDMQLVPLAGLAPIEVPRALVQLEGKALDVVIPEAALPLSQGRGLAFKSGRFVVPDVYAEDVVGELAFRSQGPAAAMLEVLEQERFGLGRLTSLPSEAIDGMTDGQFRLTLPLKADLPASDIKLEARVRLTDGRARQLVGNFDAQAATIAFDVKEKTIDAKGDLLLAGVPAKVSWQRILGATPDKQPPLRLTATLDNSDRAQLGLDLNHVVQGEVPVELTMTRTAQNEPQVRVRADLTNAELMLEAAAWRKPQGRPASLQFDIAKGPKHKTELQNFKLVGDDIALDGWVALDPHNRLREFSFPDCSVNVITRLAIQGSLRADNVWDVRARGQTYDGRDFFRSLFALDQFAEKSLVSRHEQHGLDLEADIDTVLGFSDVSLRGLTMQLSMRGGKLSHVTGRGSLDGGKPFAVGLQQTQNDTRKLVVVSSDAGQVFRLVGFYPSLQGGRLRLEVNLDGKGPAEKTGVMVVNHFRLLGDPVVSEVLQFPEDSRTAGRSVGKANRRYVSQAIDFDWIRVPFSVGHGQFVVEDSEIRGPLVGATMRGKADFRTQSINLGGTYVPLQGLNSAIGVIPGLGQLLAGPKGEGVLGITFAIQGPMAQPQVLVNPLSLVAPGILREMFQMTNPSPTVTPRPSLAPRSDQAAPPALRLDPEAASGWSSETIPVPQQK